MGRNDISINKKLINKPDFLWTKEHLSYVFEKSNNMVVPTNDNSTIVPTNDNSTIVPTSDNSTIVPTSDNSTIVPTSDNSTSDNSTIVPTSDNSTSDNSTIVNPTLVNPGENSLNITFELFTKEEYKQEFSFTIIITQKQYNIIIKALNKQSFMGYSSVADTILGLEDYDKMQNKERNINFGFYTVNPDPDKKPNKKHIKNIIKTTNFDEQSPLKTSISSYFTKTKRLITGSGKIKKKQTKRNKHNKKRTQKKRHNKRRNKKTQR